MYVDKQERQLEEEAKALIEYFWDRVQKSDECWTWTNPRSNRGYGLIKLPGYKGLAHRLSWQIHRGPIPDQLCVCHRCDNPPCIRPEHLFLGTHAENMRDAIRKGRSGLRRGTDPGAASPTAKYPYSVICDWRSAYANGEYYESIARRYGTSVSYVWNVVHYRNRIES